MSAEPTPTSCCSTRPAAICWSRRCRARRRTRRSACSTACASFIARGVAPGEIEFFAHGTTITTNALLEMRGAKVGPADHQGLSRGAGGAEPGARRQPVRLFLFQAATDRAAEPDARNPRALRLCRHGAGAARPRGGAARRARAEGRRRRLDRGLLPVLVHEPGARGDHAQDHPRRISRRLGVAVERGAAAHPRMVAACRPRCSTPISSRCWCATSTISTAGSTMPASARSSAS